MEQGGRLRRATGLALVGYVGFALALVVLVPPFEAPDEPGHVRYVDFVARRGELPNQLDPERHVAGQGHQAPLAYVAMATLVRLAPGGPGLPFTLVPNPAHVWHGGTAGMEVPLFAHDTSPFAGRRDAVVFYALRLLSVGLGLASLLVVSRTVARVTDDGPTRVLAVALPATLPQFVFVSSYVTADAVLILCASVTAWALVRTVQAPDRMRWYGGLGVALGLAVLAKKTALFLVPGVAATLAAVVIAGRAPLRVVARGGALLVVVTLVVAGWLFIRNAALYGDLLGDAMERATLVSLMLPRGLGDPYFRGDFPRMLGSSFVGVLGWMNLWLPSSVYWCYACLGAVIGAGVVPRLREPFVAMAAGFTLLCLAGVVFFNMTYPQPQGRYLFAALPFLALLSATGLRRAIGWLGVPAWPAVRALWLTLLALDVVVLVTVRSFFAG